MNSEKERLLNKQDKRCCTCKHYSQAKYGLSAKFPDVAGFCKRIPDNMFTQCRDAFYIVTHIMECYSKVTTTAGSSCGFWRKKNYRTRND